MGALTAHFPKQRLTWKIIPILIIPGLSAVLLPLCYGISRYYYAYAHHGSIAALHWSRPWYLLASFSLFVFLLLSYLRIKHSHQYIAIYKHGIQLNISRKLTLSWQQISGISSAIFQTKFFGLSIKTFKQTIVYPRKGKPIKIKTPFERISRLTSMMKRSLYTHLYPKLEQRLQSGQWVSFGPISINLQQLSFQDKKVNWSCIESLAIINGYLVVELEDNSTQRVAISQIPNLELLLRLAENINNQ